MSLINDALKRARESQAQAPPPPPSNLEFRPVEPAQVRQGPSLTFIATACIAVILATLLAWQWLHKPAGPGSVAAKAASAEPPALPAPAPYVASATAPPTATVSAPAKVAEPAPPPTDPRLIASAATPAGNPPSGVAPAPVVESVPPKPAPPKLQAIVFRPVRPSAMISGKTMFVGDKFGEWRLVSISQESATLVGGGLTNVLVLPQ